MSEMPQAIYTAAQVRELDRRVIEEHGVEAYELMRRAGQAAFAALEAQWPKARRVVVLAGRGNNGGDGYVIARLARESGRESVVLRLGDHANLAGAAARAASDCREAGVPLEDYRGGALPPSDVYVDALLGTGLDRPLQGEVLEAVRQLSRAGAPVMAVDVPSGLDADTGAVLGACASADLTVTFIGLKLGLFTGSAPAVTGRVRFASLDAPPAAYEGMEPAARRIASADLARWLPPRQRAAHKGHFGHVLVIGGERGMSGAARLAGEAAMRAGSGLVSIATREVHAAMLSAARPELMAHGVEQAGQLAPLLARATVVALGPGLGTGDWGKRLWLAALRARQHLVLDADGLNWLARLPRERADWVLTPHPGEAARLLGVEAAVVQSDRPAAARELARRYRAVAVLKGAGTLVADLDGRLALCDRGNPGMASAGMGDVLTGLVAGLLAQGLAPFDAACAGVHAHAHAADRAAREGERGLAAGDVLAELRDVLNPVTG